LVTSPMLKKFLFIFLIEISFGQISIYKQSYDQAFQDSVLTIEEQKMLDILQESLKLSDADISNLKTVEENISEKPVFSQAGRPWIIVQNMSMGNGLYGWGIPYIADINDGEFLA
ncbi:MAG: hypothetical protein V3S48_03020, partial [Candidatus Neomarinimicrobiota bacterium]